MRPKPHTVSGVAHVWPGKRFVVSVRFSTSHEILGLKCPENCIYGGNCLLRHLKCYEDAEHGMTVSDCVVAVLIWKVSTPMLRESVLIAACVLGLLGCQKASQPVFVSSTEFQALKPELQEPIRKALSENCGTPALPKMLWRPEFDPQRLQQGYQVYRKRCVQCHGTSGDGNGPVAKSLYPRPRDYRKGVFKFASTPYGSKPVRSDLISTVNRGVAGTSMPSFHLLPAADVEAVVDYVLALTHRGELEGQLTTEVASAEEYEADVFKDTLELIRNRWVEADQAVYQPLTPQPVLTAEHVAAGRAAFLSKGCAQCHGTDGRGQTPENLKGDRQDAWGYPTRAADLTSGMLHGGPRPIDVYRRIYGGINGTPMPAFAVNLKDEPETIWNLVAYVLHVSGRRRDLEVPPSGNIAPYVTAAISAAK